jgi:hypothetical protein
MRELLLLAIHLIVTVAKLLRPGGARSVAAESLLLNHRALRRMDSVRCNALRLLHPTCTA